MLVLELVVEVAVGGLGTTGRLILASWLRWQCPEKMNFTCGNENNKQPRHGMVWDGMECGGMGRDGM